MVEVERDLVVGHAGDVGDGLLPRRDLDGEVTQPERLTDVLRAARASLWTLEIAPAGATSGAGRKPSSSPLDEALTMGTQVGGGLRETLTGAAAIVRPVEIERPG